MGGLRETFVDELRDLFDAEKQLLKALPKLAKAAENEDLKAAFEQHIEETEGQIERLKEVFQLFDEQPRGKKCKGMEGLIEEGAEMIEEEAGDAALICAAQKAEHYEIATYGSLSAWAKLLGEDQAVELLEENLQEEKAADEKLTEIAESVVNVEEEQEGEEDKPVARRGAKTAKR
ncbi:MAG TPA: ferritin-like domain-containing protein [Methylomirabilota bacterium]|nr:ferritin-like domain-containing protein [Methylomirabilota bacterium]